MRTGIDHDVSVNVRGANVGSIVKETERKAHVGMCPKGVPLKLKVKEAGGWSLIYL